MTVNFLSSARRFWRRSGFVLIVLALLGSAGSRAFASHSVELTWNPSPSPDIVSYTVYFGTQSGQYTDHATYYATDAIVPGLEPGIYYFAVSAVDVNGVESAYSAEATCMVPVPDPLVLQAQSAPASQSVELTWDPGQGSDINYYRVYYATEPGAYSLYQTVYYTTNLVILGLAGGTTNYYQVSAVDDNGVESQLSNEAAYVVPVPVPPLLKVQGASVSRSVALNWTASTDPMVYAYLVYYGTQSGYYDNLAVYYNETNGVIAGLTVGTTNFFAVSSMDYYGVASPLSKEVEFVVHPPDPIELQLETFTDANGQPYRMQLSARAPVYGLWEVDYSTDLQNWIYYWSDYGYGNGNDLNVPVWPDPGAPSVFFRAINYY